MACTTIEKQMEAFLCLQSRNIWLINPRCKLFNCWGGRQREKSKHARYTGLFTAIISGSPYLWLKHQCCTSKGEITDWKRKWMGTNPGGGGTEFWGTTSDKDIHRNARDTVCNWDKKAFLIWNENRTFPKNNEGSLERFFLTLWRK